MSFVRIWVHVVFTTQNREPYLSAEVRTKLFEHIRTNCPSKGVYLDRIGGWTDHVHLLISLGRTQDISKLVMLIKGESVHWLNQQNLLRGKFRWQDDYYAISVSESLLAKVRAYIEGQEEHHRAVPFERELEILDQITDGKLG